MSEKLPIHVNNLIVSVLQKLFLVCLLFFLYGICGFSQVFHRLTEDNGLPSNFCNDIAQDSFGLVWIATENGLCSFDGINFRVYHHQSGEKSAISTNIIQTLYTDSSGTLWAIGYDGILNRYNHIEDRFQQLPIPLIHSLSDQRIYDMIHIDSTLWLAAEEGLIKYDLRTEKSLIIKPGSKISNPHTRYLNTIYGLHRDQDNSDKLWLATRGGLVSIILSTQKITYHTQYTPQIPDPGQYALKNIYQQEDGTLWVSGSWSGLRHYNPKTRAWTRYFDGFYPESGNRNDIQDIIPKSDNEFWVASVANGFGIFNTEKGEYNYLEYQADNPYSAPMAPAIRLLRDRQHSIWMIGQQGVSYFHPDLDRIHMISFPERRTFHAHTDILASSFEMISDDEVLVGTTSGDGLYIANINEGTCEVVENYVGKDFFEILEKQTSTDYYDLQIQDMIKVSDHKIWVALDTQFAYFDINHRSLHFPEQTNRSFYQHAFIRYLQLDKKGYLWGLNRSEKSIFQASAADGSLIKVFPYSEILPAAIKNRQQQIASFFIDEDGLFWFNTESQVFTRDMENGTDSLFQNSRDGSSGIKGKELFNIAGTDDGTILISSFLNGLQLIKANDGSGVAFDLIGLDDGLPIEKVVKVVTRGDVAWLATRKGLVQYHLSSGKVTILNKKDGIPNPDLLNYWTIGLDITEEGHVFFSNPDQIGWIDGNDLYDLAEPPHVFFTDIKIQSKNKKVSRHIRHLQKVALKAEENFFTISFASDDYIFPNDQKFRYRLLGYDEDWVDAGNERSATYTKVPGGKYTFELLGANAYGVWTSVPKQVELIIETPFFQSNLFYGMLFAGLLLASYGIYRFRVEQIKEREKLKADFSVQLAEVEMSALRAQMNPHFVFNSLNSINKYILTNEPRMASRYLTKFSKLMRLILNNSKSKEISLEDELSALTLYVDMEQLRFDQKFEFIQEIKTIDALSQILIPPMLIQPYIENAIWHGLMPLDKPGRLKLSLLQEGGVLQCIIDDTGVGRERAVELQQKNEVKKKSMGMQITSDRLHLVEALHHIKTELEIVDKKDNNGNAIGTRVILKIPIKKLELPTKTSTL